MGWPLRVQVSCTGAPECTPEVGENEPTHRSVHYKKITLQSPPAKIAGGLHPGWHRRLDILAGAAQPFEP